MGLAVGSVAAAAIWLGGPRKVWLLVFAIAVLAIGLPGLGTNAGGTVTAVVTFGLLYLVLSCGSFKPRHVAALVGLGVLLLVLFAALDVATNGRGASHVGLSLAATQHDGIAYVVVTAGRKLGMNLQQLGSRQGRLALTGAVPLGVLWYLGIRPRLARQKAITRAMGIRAAIVGAVVALLCNDNGAVAACLLLTPITAALFLSLMAEEN